MTGVEKLNKIKINKSSKFIFILFSVSNMNLLIMYVHTYVITNLGLGCFIENVFAPITSLFTFIISMVFFNCLSLTNLCTVCPQL